MLGSLLETLKALEIPLKTAWTAALIGLPGLILSAFGVWPFADDQELKAVLFAGLLLFGAARLVVEAGSFLAAKFEQWRAKKAEQTRVAEKAAEDEQQALKNLEALRKIEVQQLVFVLRAGRQRFDRPVVYSLLEKRIFVNALDPYASTDLYDVADCVWHRREDILEKYRKIPETREFPVERFVA